MAVVNEVSTVSHIPQFVPFGLLYYTQDTGDLYIGTGFSTGSDYVGGNPGPNVNVELISSPGGLPGGFNGDIQYNNNGNLGGSAATITAAGAINALSITATTATVTSTLELQTATIVDSLGSTGTVGQALESTGTGVKWAAVSSTETWAALTGAMTATQVAPWYNATSTIDSGISRLGAASLAIGNGTAGDVSGQLTAHGATLGDITTPYSVATLIVNQGTAVSANYGMEIHGTQDYSGVGLVGFFTGTNAFPVTYIHNDGGIYTAAEIIASGHYNHSGSYIDILPPSSDEANIGIWADVGTAFQSRTNTPGDINASFLSSAGNHVLTIGDLGGLSWGTSTQAAQDTGLSRLGAASLAIGNGTAGDSSGALLAAVHGFGATATSASPDTGISRLGAASLAIGNGTAGDYSGSVQLTQLVVNNASGSTGVAASISFIGNGNSSTYIYAENQRINFATA